jgi:chitinase
MYFSIILLVLSTIASGSDNSPIMQGWFYNVESVDNGSHSLLTIPEYIDIVDIFAPQQLLNSSSASDEFWTRIRTQVDFLHSRNQKVVFCIWLSLWFTGYEFNSEGYTQFAQDVSEIIETVHLDGIDIDVEDGTIFENGTDSELVNALSTKFGPASKASKLFIYDTNVYGDEPLINASFSLYDYVFQQTYWDSVSTVESIWESYETLIDPSKFLISTDYQDESG